MIEKLQLTDEQVEIVETVAVSLGKILKESSDPSDVIVMCATLLAVFDCPDSLRRDLLALSDAATKEVLVRKSKDVYLVLGAAGVTEEDFK